MAAMQSLPWLLLNVLDDYTHCLVLFLNRISEGNDLLDKVNQTAQEALDKASQIYSDALDSLNNAERVAVPDDDTSIYLEEAKALLEDVS